VSRVATVSSAGTALAAFAAESVTITALFGLKYDGALAFKGRAACEQFGVGTGTLLHASITGDHGA